MKSYICLQLIFSSFKLIPLWFLRFYRLSGRSVIFLFAVIYYVFIAISHMFPLDKWCGFKFIEISVSIIGNCKELETKFKLSRVSYNYVIGDYLVFLIVYVVISILPFNFPATDSRNHNGSFPNPFQYCSWNVSDVVFFLSLVFFCFICVCVCVCKNGWRFHLTRSANGGCFRMASCCYRSVRQWSDSFVRTSIFSCSVYGLSKWC